MKVIKNINNNVSLCMDSHNNEVVVFGKGIGFRKPPYEIDLEQVQRTYYNVDPAYIDIINNIPQEIFDIADKTINYARLKLKDPISSNVVFTLADHISFAIRRYRKNMNIPLPFAYDIQHLYETEMEIGSYALALIRRKMGIALPKDEAASIAIHILNAEMKPKKKNQLRDEEVISHVTEMIEADYGIKIDQNDFNYSRFVTHMYYLLNRGKKNEFVNSDNQELFDAVAQAYPKADVCAGHIREYLKREMKWELNDEECLYLMMHINRLCEREEDCGLV